jgi:transcriptional regulator with XRE-family HTH domain
MSLNESYSNDYRSDDSSSEENLISTEQDSSESGNEAWRKALNTHLGSRIRLRRKQLRMSQTSLGQLVGLTFQQVQKYEHGSNRISAARLFDMARVLGVHPMFFLQGFPEATIRHTSSGFHEDQEPLSAATGYEHAPDAAEMADLFSQIENAGLRAHILEVVRALVTGASNH